jgi:catechol 2,3-dioxygenase-like lactoylglutathione lyase family enzyme
MGMHPTLNAVGFTSEALPMSIDRRSVPVLLAALLWAPSPVVPAQSPVPGVPATATSATGTGATAAPAPSPAVDRARLLRTALIVRDVDRSLRFYALFGYAPESEMGGPREPAKTAFPLNAAATRFRLVILGSPASPGARIGLVAFDDPPAKASRRPRRKVGEGDMVFVFDVADAQQAHDRLRAAGADIVETPQVYASKQLDERGRPMQGRVFHVFDPDGNLIELLEAPRAVVR